MNALKLFVNKPTAIAVTAIVFFLVNIVSRFPGFPNLDSNLQYNEAVSGHFSDWQPPIMAWLWSGLRLILDGTGLLFSLQVIFYWFGFGLIAITLSRIGRGFAAWAVIAVALLPPFLMLNIQILKDVGLAVTFLSSFAIIFWYRSQSKRVSPPAATFAIVLLLYGSLVRANAVFAVPPLLIYIFYPQLLFRPIRFLAACFIVITIMIPASNLFNHAILHAKAAHPLQSLEIFDIAGIAHFSNDMSVFGDERLTKNLLSECYTPVLWDTLNGKNCHVFLDSLGPQSEEKWISAIIRHPLAYAEHRITHFCSELNSFLLIHHSKDSVYDWTVYIHVQPVTLKEKIYDYMRFCAIFTPCFSLVLGCVVLTLAFRGAVKNPSSLENAAFCLAVSGLFYLLAYLLIGVASDFRYQYWDMIAIFVASVICMSEKRNCFLPLSGGGAAFIGILSVALVIVQIAQLIERNTQFPSGVEIDERTKQKITEPKS